MRKVKKYANEVIALAKELYADDAANGTLKPARGLIAIGGRGGVRSSIGIEVTWRDYLPDAARIIEAAKHAD